MHHPFTQSLAAAGDPPPMPLSASSTQSETRRKSACLSTDSLLKPDIERRRSIASTLTAPSSNSSRGRTHDGSMSRILLSSDSDLPQHMRYGEHTICVTPPVAIPLSSHTEPHCRSSSAESPLLLPQDSPAYFEDEFTSDSFDHSDCDMDTVAHKNEDSGGRSLLAFHMSLPSGLNPLYANSASEGHCKQLFRHTDSCCKADSQVNQSMAPTTELNEHSLSRLSAISDYLPSSSLQLSHTTLNDSHGSSSRIVSTLHPALGSPDLLPIQTITPPKRVSLSSNEVSHKLELAELRMTEQRLAEERVRSMQQQQQHQLAQLHSQEDDPHRIDRQVSSGSNSTSNSLTTSPVAQALSASTIFKRRAKAVAMHAVPSNSCLFTMDG